MKNLYLAALLGAVTFLGTTAGSFAQTAEPVAPSKATPESPRKRAMKIKHVSSAVVAYQLDPAHNHRPISFGEVDEDETQTERQDAFSLPEGITEIVSIDAQNVLLVGYTNDEAMRQVQELIDVLDQPLRQIEIEAQIVAMSPGDAKTFEIDFGPQQNNAKSENAPQIGSVKGNAMARLNALIADDKAKVLRAPRITLDDKFAGQLTLAEPLRATPTSPENGDKFEITSQVSTSPALLLNVDAVIKGDDSLDFKIDVISETAPTNGVTTTKSLLSGNINVRDGESWVLKNLPFPNTRRNFKVPLLGDIPNLSGLFRSKSQTQMQTIVFVTARVIKQPEIYDAKLSQ